MSFPRFRSSASTGAAVEHRRPGLSDEKKLRALVRDQIGTMVGDLITETQLRIEASGGPVDR